MQVWLTLVVVTTVLNTLVEIASVAHAPIVGPIVACPIVVNPCKAPMITSLATKACQQRWAQIHSLNPDLGCSHQSCSIPD